MTTQVVSILNEIDELDKCDYEAFCTDCGCGIMKDDGWFTKEIGNDSYDYCENCWEERRPQ